MLPKRFAFDRRLPDEATVRAALDERAITPFGPGEDLDRLHRVLYPAFRLTFEYEASELLSFGANRETTTTLVDGLVEGNDRFVHEYVDGTADPVTVDPGEFDLGSDHPGLGTTVMLEFQATNDRAESVLVERLLDYRERRAAAGEEAAAVFLNKFKDAYGLPNDFDPDGGIDVVDVSRVYLPFWLAEFRADSADHAYIVSFRDESDADVDHPDGWVAEWVSGDPTVVGDFGYEVDLDRVQRSAGDAGSDGTGSDRGVGDAETNHEGGPDPLDSSGSRGAGAGDGDTEAVQPDGVEMNADSLVDLAPDHGFGEVGGMADLKETLRHKVVRPVTDPDRFAEYGLSVVNGVLLHGPPGCGKTYVTRALAGELGHAFVEVSPADVTSKYMGEPAQKVADVFEIARANAPCLLFIDEIDGIAGDRGGGADMNSSEQQLVNQLLTELESLDDHDVVVVGATNLLEDVDPAIRRSGRFDERVEVPPPDADARRAILDLHLAGRPTVDDLDRSPAVERTVGYAASDLELIAENAAREALRDEAPIGKSHLESALESTESSIGDWVGVSHKEGTHVVQPDGVDLSAHSLVTVDVDQSFGDVGGMAELKARLRETVLDPLSNPETYDRYDIDVLSGLLLYGPPGCGKTHVTRALAGELDHAFVEVSPADLTSKWMGKPEENVADLFEIARANAPCLLFIDEIDAVAGSRGGMSQGSQGMVNQLLTELEALDEDDVVAVGATNLLEDVDGAIRRSGRFDERVEVSPPDVDARREILDLHLGERPVADAVDWDRIVAGTEGYAASDLELLAENAARNALRAGDPIDDDHLDAALDETQSSLRNWGDGDRYAESDAGSDLQYFG
ncbi:holliday junction DNA helicase [Halosimplex carlsbadense 2-9-1]|uniref:Holliday junction DNA helicase n=1 Tax=Halosimplex carlsbadense 2-9-1 TaxID=797114 RepID=M0CAF3_9EURY|nr:AAA family ATPase [Halosimplex carlsbadense]ELZ20276.1 holliday junction DNA helicase [Halosimplex carlsbadense 2-9-1]